MKATIQHAALQVLAWAKQAGLDDDSLVILGALAFAFIALFFAIRAQRLLRLLTGPQASRLLSRVEQLELKLSSLENRLSAEQHKIRGDVRALREQLRAMGVEAPAAVEEEQAAPGKKKTEITPLAPPALSAEEELRAGLAKTRTSFFTRLRELFAGAAPEDGLYTGLEELLITSDLGVRTAASLVGRLKERTVRGEQPKEADLRAQLKTHMLGILRNPSPAEIIPEKVAGKPKVVLIAGVNGVGKTTTIGKLAFQMKQEGARVLLAACDTFRAAADEQLEIWAKRAQVEVVGGVSGKKPSTVAYEAVHRALDEGYDVLLVDTAGRLHTRENLMNELTHVVQILARELPGAPHESILVLDASTGQNAIAQARVFHDRLKLTGIIVTKLDGTAKGGVIIPIKEELGVPIRYIGVGESIEALRPFSAEKFVEALFDASA